MSSSAPEAETEAELEAFRRRWREEVSARNRHSERRRGLNHDETKNERGNGLPLSAPRAGPSAPPRRDVQAFAEEIAPRSYHDLPDDEERFRLGEEGQNHDRLGRKEPKSALEHYERAVEKETQGQLGDSMKHYRKAFKLDDSVQEAYKRKHFPPPAPKSKPTESTPSNASATVPNTAHHSSQGGEASTLPPTLKQLVEGFSALRIEAAAPPTDASPQEPSLLAELPEEILTPILEHLAIVDVAAYVRLAQVCKRLAFLVLTEESIWKRVALGGEYGFRAMKYDFACRIDGSPLSVDDELPRYLGAYDDDVDPTSSPSESEVGPSVEPFDRVTELLLRKSYASSWRTMFRNRPRIRFNGCYISTVNYTRPGANSANTLSWGAPVHVVTYYRYLRFFRDGSAISLLTTTEPADVVHHLTKDNLHSHHSNALPSSVMKDALSGRWRLSSPISSFLDPETGEPEPEGDLHIETEGVISKYTYKLQLGLTHVGKGARNNKLAWKGFWSHNRLTDDWGEFGLKNDRAFYWSRVKSYGTGQQPA